MYDGNVGSVARAFWDGDQITRKPKGANSMIQKQNGKAL